MYQPDMIKHVRFDKKTRVVDELIRRIESGLMEDGFQLPGEHQLAEEFGVSRGTLREALAELKHRLGTDQFIALDRRRRSTEGRVLSLERSLIPASGELEGLPRVGLIDDSLTITLAAYGYIGERGDQWIGAEPLNAEDAELLGRAPGEVFLKALRTTYDRQGRFMEQVESLLDPQHFRLHLQFGESG